MTTQNVHFESIIKNLQEREKELNCLYNVEEILNSTEKIEDALYAIIQIIPPGWKHPECCQAAIRYHDQYYHPHPFLPTEWVLRAPIEVEGHQEGEIAVYYTENMPLEAEGPFLKEERKLLDNIADRIGKYIAHQHSKKLIKRWEAAKESISLSSKYEWQVIMDLLKKTDQGLFIYITRKMTYYLCWNGIKEAQQLLQKNVDPSQLLKPSNLEDAENRPSPKISLNILNLATRTFEIATTYLSNEEILMHIQRWIQESRISFLYRTLASLDTSLGEIASAIRRFYHIMPDIKEIPASTQKAINVALIRRFLTGQLEFITVGKDYIDIHDMHDILQRLIFSVRSRGQLGGKSAGLILASKIIEKTKDHHLDLQHIKVPKTWYITSDGSFYFMHSNNFEETVEQKYKPMELIRLEYPHIVQIFKNSPFPPEILTGLSMALDDFGDHPLIVRSSSLLEDRLGMAFSGKYKSLFLANQGTKTERLEALTDAIAEVYASLFSPDPIEYRIERGLVDFNEEMGIMIQQVVGQKVGKYFLPAYAGVAVSNNEFRWSPRIKRKDGLIRLVPGLGTRAVDRVSDDYPILIAPGQPNLRVNITIDEYVRYAPKKVDVIDLETNTFETIEFAQLIKEYGDQMPDINNIVSVLHHDHLSTPGITTDFAKAAVLVTFEGLRTRTPFVQQIRTILNVLEKCLHSPVDIEFASDGQDLYLLQCRPQSAFARNEAALIPRDIPRERVLFSANKYVSNGKIPGITHIVYVDPHEYNALEEHAQLLDVGHVVSKLNKVLPKRQFILIGPGRWGSRGDIKLGVNVTYSDINNTAALIELAMKKGSYVPELSFGTHFFQDLVEASIRYLPLYPGDDGVIFNERFFTTSPNVLAQLLPEYAYLSHTVKVIDLPAIANGQVLCLAMNADLDQALAYLDSPQQEEEQAISTGKDLQEPPSENYWQWRLRMATYIASQIDAQRFGVKGCYIFGSTKNATAGPQSDIDLLFHIHSTPQQLDAFKAWLEGWSLCLDEMNFLRTGHRTGGLLDSHFVTDDDIAKRSSFALKINAVTDAASKLAMKDTY